MRSMTDASARLSLAPAPGRRRARAPARRRAGCRGAVRCGVRQRAAPAASLPDLPSSSRSRSPSPTRPRSRSSIGCSSGSVPRTSAPARDARNAIAEVARLDRSRRPPSRAGLRATHRPRGRRARPRGCAQGGAQGAQEQGRGQGRGRNKGDGKKEKKGKAHRDEEVDDGDWLDFLLASPHPGDKSWQDLVHLFGMTRMLAAVGTTPAVREMVQLYAHFGDLVRIDLQRQIAQAPRQGRAGAHRGTPARRQDRPAMGEQGARRPRPRDPGRGGGVERYPDPRRRPPRLRSHPRRRRGTRHPLVLQQRSRAAPRGRARGARRHRRGGRVADPRPVPRPHGGEAAASLGVGPPRARALRALRPPAALGDPQADGRGRRHAADAGKLAAAVDAFDKVLARAPLFERRREMAPTYFGARGSSRTATATRRWR